MRGASLVSSSQISLSFLLPLRTYAPPNPRSAMATRHRAARLKEKDPPPGKRQRTAVGSAAAPNAPAPAPDPPIEFAGRDDDVDALLNEKMKGKNKMDYKDALRSYGDEKEARSAAETSRNELSEELNRVKLEQKRLNDQIKMLHDTNKRLQEYNSNLQADATKNAETITKLQRENNNLQETCSSQTKRIKTLEVQLASANEKLKRSDLTTMETIPVDLPDELIISEILVRLPAKELLRCGAACRTWRRLTSTAAFLLAHHRRQPLLPLVSFLTPLNSSRSDGVVRIAVDALDFRRSPAARRPVLGFNEGNNFTIHASCDGLLILSLSDSRFYVCNPATRQWFQIPYLIGNVIVNVAALYLHRPSGEYRVLYWKDTRSGKPDYYIVTLGSSQKPRGISPPMASPSMKRVKIRHASKHPPVFLHSCLHWHPASASHGNVVPGKVTIFDTVLESFRSVRSPTTAGSSAKWFQIYGRASTGRHGIEAGSPANLVEIDGTLGITHIDDATMEVKLWVLDYDTEVWSLKHRIALPLAGGVPDYSRRTAVLENLDMLLSRPYLPGHLFHCDGDGKLVKKFPCDGVITKLIELCFRESLVRHEFFPSRDGHRVRKQPRFFGGL